MANAIGPARAFFVRLEHLLAEYPGALSIVLRLQVRNHLLGEGSRFSLDKFLLPENLVTAGMGQ